MTFCCKEGNDIYCARCHKKITDCATVDHFIPKAWFRQQRMQTNTPLVLLCQDCNQYKSNKIVSAHWYGYLLDYEIRYLVLVQRRLFREFHYAPQLTIVFV